MQLQIQPIIPQNYKRPEAPRVDVIVPYSAHPDMPYVESAHWNDGTKMVPYHVGVYKVQGDCIGYFSYWNGEFWGQISTCALGAERLQDTPSHTQNRDWRGCNTKETS